ncbi:phage tail tube protein [Clostridium sp.]|uniref:phage tail tube protein n=1 Tax=Clostridium sp. TaxID=1506 RepID=UPI002606EBB0|nr:phage tail tube protein [Clostridium sp.]
MAVNKNNILTGVNGDVWFNGALMATLKSIKCTVKSDTETENFIGDGRTYTIWEGWSGDGSLTLAKIDSSVWKMAANAFKSGITPDLKIISSLTNSSGETEKVAIEGVMFSQFDLINIESKKVNEESYSITFDDYEVIDTI